MDGDLAESDKHASELAVDILRDMLKKLKKGKYTTWNEVVSELRVRADWIQEVTNKNFAKQTKLEATPNEKT